MVLLPFFRALHIAATVMIGGAFAFEFLILGTVGPARATPAVSAAIARWLRVQCACGIVIGIVSWAGWLALTAIAMSGRPASQALSPAVLATVIGRTTFGHAWLIRLALFALLGIQLMLTHRRSAPGGVMSFACALALVASLAWTGHALGTDRVHVWVDAMHLLAAAVWLGMLPLLWLVADRSVSGSPWSELALACAKGFFVPGVIAVLVLAATGLANTSWMLDNVSQLATTAYGRILAIKIALFALMVVFALLNRLVLLPRAEHAQTAGTALTSFRRSVLAELALGAAVLVVVAWLGVTPPVSHEHMAHDMGSM